MKPSSDPRTVARSFTQEARRRLLKSAWRVSPTAVATARYLKHRGRLPDFDHPSDISEVILGQILRGEAAAYAQFADKLEARSHLIRWGHGHLLPKLYGVWDDPDEIPFDSLPDSFILKPTNGTGVSYRRTGDHPLDPTVVRSGLKSAMAEVIDSSEPQYAGIEPRCLAEQLVGDGRSAPIDYKFMTCGGIVHGVLVCTERDTRTRLSFFDTDWNFLPWVVDDYLPATLPKAPAQLDAMIATARDIAGRFPQVRVDMYAPNPTETYVGELTFTPQGGYVTYFTNHGAIQLAKGWNGSARHKLAGR